MKTYAEKIENLAPTYQKRVFQRNEIEHLFETMNNNIIIIDFLKNIRMYLNLKHRRLKLRLGLYRHC